MGIFNGSNAYEIDRLTKRIGQQTTPEDIADATRYRDQNIADLERHNQY
jgi:hypothetical protein